LQVKILVALGISATVVKVHGVINSIPIAIHVVELGLSVVANAEPIGKVVAAKPITNKATAALVFGAITTL
jgi:hypothetical protein